MTTSQLPPLPVIEQYPGAAPPVAEAPPVADVSLDDAKDALNTAQRFTELLERVVASMARLMEARAEARRAAGEAAPQPVAVAAPAHAELAYYGDGLPPPSLTRPGGFAPPPPMYAMPAESVMPAQAPLPPPEPPPPAEPPPTLNDLLTDDALDRVFDLAIGYAQQNPTETFAHGAKDLDANRGLIRDVVRKALTADGG